jgi:hypothetical protein
MDIFWQTALFRLAEHAQVIIPLVLGLFVLGLGPIGRALARRISGGEAGQHELESLRKQVAELQERADYNDRILGTLRRQLPPESNRPADGDTATPP